MKMPWQVHRTAVAQHDGERRWDNAYQLLLQWAMEDEADSGLAPSHQQEESHGNRSLCAGFDDSSTAAADD